MQKFILAILLLFTSKIFAQSTDAQPQFYVLPFEINLVLNVEQQIILPRSITSFVLEIKGGDQLGKTVISTQNQTIQLKNDAHDNQTNHSELIIFDQAVTSFKIVSNSLNGRFKCKLIFVNPIIINTLKSNARIEADCQKPTVIPISTWRVGLTPPKELPAQSVVKHLIVHHAAGSNTNTNYADVVRNIYVFHTESNGWNDVGYNFLIAQDGTIFEGRDGQGRADGDNVIGAHFCSQNTGTMGVCMLGDYMLVQPPQKALDALAKLLAWKEAKEKIDPTGRTLHSASGKSLFNISAHRDGSCSTDCPGNNLYAKLDEIRQSTVKSCDGLVVVPVVTAGFTDELNLIESVYPNPSNGQFVIETAKAVTQKDLKLMDGLGRELNANFEQINTKQWKLDAKHLNEGLYFIRIDHKDVSKTKKILISKKD
jgi:hypothetical protein